MKNIKDLDMQAKIFFDDEDESKSSGDKHEGPGQVLQETGEEHVGM